MQIRNLFVAIVCLAVIGFVSEQSQAQRPNNLFSQYYTQPGASQVHAAMYPAPHPVPHHVGSSHYTYQPLMPHEMMYAHSREYYNYYATPESFYCNQCGGSPRSGYGVTKTSVRWQSGCNTMAPLPGIFQPVQHHSHLWNRWKSVPRNPINRFLSCTDGFGLGGRLAGRCASGDCGSSGYESAGGGCMDGGCMDGNCGGSWESYVARWEQKNRAAAARTASAMQNRYSR